jgi:hypothetical protein
MIGLSVGAEATAAVSSAIVLLLLLLVMAMKLIGEAVKIATSSLACWRTACRPDSPLIPY